MASGSPTTRFPVGTALREADGGDRPRPRAAGVRTLGTLDDDRRPRVGVPDGPGHRGRRDGARAPPRPARGGRASCACPSPRSCRVRPSRSSRRSATAGTCASARTRSGRIASGARPRGCWASSARSLRDRARPGRLIGRPRGSDTLPGLPFGRIVLLGRPETRRQRPARGLDARTRQASRSATQPGTTRAIAGPSSASSTRMRPHLGAVGPGAVADVGRPATASPWLTASRSSPTCTQPPPLTTMNSETCGLVCGGTIALARERELGHVRTVVAPDDLARRPRGSRAAHRHGGGRDRSG